MPALLKRPPRTPALILGCFVAAVAGGCADAGPAGLHTEHAARAMRMPIPAPQLGDPTKPDVVITVLAEPGGRCDVTTAARTVDGAEMRLLRAQPVVPGVCRAHFVDLEPERRYVFSARNAVIDDPLDYEVWPNFRDVPWDDMPAQEGAVFVPALTGGYTDGEARRLIAENVYAAYERARPIPAPTANSAGPFQLTIPLQYGNVRTVEALVPLAESDVFVYSIGQLDPARLPAQAQPSPYPPGIGWYAVRTASAATLQLADEVTVVVKGRDEDGNIYSGMLPPGETSVVLSPDPAFFFTYYIVDPYGDHPTGANDITLVRYGTELMPGPVQSDDLLVKIDLRGLAVGATTPQLGIELRSLRDPLGQIVLPELRVQLHCGTGGQPQCSVAGVVPGEAAHRVLGVTSDLSAGGDGWVMLRLSVDGIDSARLRVRGGVGNSAVDLAPDLGLTLGPNIDNGLAVWQRTDSPGTSWSVPW